MPSRRRPLALLAALLSAAAAACAGVLGFDEGSPPSGPPDAAADAQPSRSAPPVDPGGDEDEPDASADAAPARDASPATDAAARDAAPEASTSPGCLGAQANYFCTGYDEASPAVGPAVAKEMYTFTTQAPRSAPRALRGQFDLRATAFDPWETRRMAAPNGRLRASLAVRVASGTAESVPTVLQLVAAGQSQGWRIVMEVSRTDVAFTVRGLQTLPHPTRVPRGQWAEIAVLLERNGMTLIVDGKPLRTETSPIAASWDVSWGAANGDGLVLDFDDVTIDAR